MTSKSNRGRGGHRTPPGESAGEPNWQPISMLPRIQQVVTGMLDGAADQERLLRQARPYSLDEHTLDEVHRVFSENDRGGADHAVFEQQLARWQRDHSGTDGLDRLAADVGKLRPAYLTRFRE
jgi:hypothetical protein